MPSAASLRWASSGIVGLVLVVVAAAWLAPAGDGPDRIRIIHGGTPPSDAAVADVDDRDLRHRFPGFVDALEDARAHGTAVRTVDEAAGKDGTPVLAHLRAHEDTPDEGALWIRFHGDAFRIEPHG